MKRVLIRPPWNPWLQNRMFTGRQGRQPNTSYRSDVKTRSRWSPESARENDILTVSDTGAEGCVYTSAFALWRQTAEAHGFQLDTWDMVPLSQADCVWMMDLPPWRRTYEQARRAVRPGTPFVLQTLESPLLGPQNFVEANRRRFQAVVTYEPDADEKSLRFAYRLPNTLRSPSGNLLFAERRLAVMLNSNRVEGYLGMRQPGLSGLPGLGRFFSGWSLPVSRLFDPAPGELYSWRRELARTADRIGDGLLDVFGAGWHGEQISWFPGYRNPRYRCAATPIRQCAAGSENRTAKHELLGHYRFGIATENCQANYGYVSEKLFDVLIAGAVPVYLGDERIAEQVTPECFVDARRFPNHGELLAYLRDCPEHEWQAMRDAGQRFLLSDRMRPFTDEAFAARMVEVLQAILGTAA